MERQDKVAQHACAGDNITIGLTGIDSVAIG